MVGQIASFEEEARMLQAVNYAMGKSAQSRMNSLHARCQMIRTGQLDDEAAYDLAFQERVGGVVPSASSPRDLASMGISFESVAPNAPESTTAPEGNV